MLVHISVSLRHGFVGSPVTRQIIGFSLVRTNLLRKKAFGTGARNSVTSLRKGTRGEFEMAPDLGKLGAGGHDYDYDMFVIGGGSAGVRAARFSGTYGAEVAICELPYNPVSTETTFGGLGGTCVLRGCVPKKIFVYGSSYRTDFEDAKGFGWEIEASEVKFNWKRLMQNKTKELARLNAVYDKLLGDVGVTIFEGFAEFVDKHTVEVKHSNGEVKKYTANHILVSTGSRAQLLNIPGKELAITSDEALSLEDLPKKVVICGGGYIAVEFAGIFNGMGSEVHLVYRKNLPLTGFDKEMQGIVAHNLEARGIHLHPGTNISKLSKTEDGKIKAVSDKAGDFIADAVMFATGRKPNSKWLKLDAAGVEVDVRSGAVKVNEYSQTNVPNIWATGDVTDRIMLTPVVLMESNALSKTLFGGTPTKPDYETCPSAVFCQPNLAVVGLNEEQAVAKASGDVVVFSTSFNSQKNTIAGRNEKIHMKLLVDGTTDKVLGAAMCGPESAEIIQCLAVALKCGATKAQFDSTLAIHPTSSEEFVTLRTATRRVNREGDVSKL